MAHQLKKPKHWEVDVSKKELESFIGVIDTPDFTCSVEPKRISGYYELKFSDGATLHIMADTLESIEWKPVYED